MNVPVLAGRAWHQRLRLILIRFSCAENIGHGLRAVFNPQALYDAVQM